MFSEEDKQAAHLRVKTNGTRCIGYWLTV